MHTGINRCYLEVELSATRKGKKLVAYFFDLLRIYGPSIFAPMSVCKLLPEKPAEVIN
jgi:hypothetical protein